MGQPKWTIQCLSGQKKPRLSGAKSAGQAPSVRAMGQPFKWRPLAVFVDHRAGPTDSPCHDSAFAVGLPIEIASGRRGRLVLAFTFQFGDLAGELGYIKAQLRHLWIPSWLKSAARKLCHTDNSHQPCCIHKSPLSTCAAER